MKNIYINTEIHQANTQKKKLACQNLIGKAISHKYILLQDFYTLKADESVYLFISYCFTTL